MHIYGMGTREKEAQEEVRFRREETGLLPPPPLPPTIAPVGLASSPSRAGLLPSPPARYDPPDRSGRMAR